MAADITAIILTKNEERNIRDCICSIKELVKRIVVIDSFSTDDTIHIAEKYGAEVYQHEFINYAKQYLYGVEIAAVKTVWILRIDADERFTKDSAKELERICNENTMTDVAGVVLRFRKNFLGKDLYHGGVYPWKKMNCYKAKIGNIEDRMMDEHIVLNRGSVVEMKNDCLHYDIKSLEFWINKHNWYSSRETVDYFNHINNPQNRRDVALKTWVKNKFYYKLPIGMRAYLYYFFRYYLQLGFLDGREGRIYCFLQAYWYRFLVDAKIFECEKTGIRYSGKGSIN